MEAVMTDARTKGDDDNRRLASVLYSQAREFELRRDYAAARKLYEQSLRLYEDEAVLEAYSRLLATIGPL